MRLYQRLIVRLLHLANASPPSNRTEFYALKTRLLKRYATFRGHEMQEIKKQCWGESHYKDGDERYRPCGPKCRRCGGTGIFDLRWVRLERYLWLGYVFHSPAGDTRVRPDSVQIRGIIEHQDYGRKSAEAVLWLYLLTGNWRMFGRQITRSYCCGWFWWPLLNVQRIATKFRMKLRRQRCWCGRGFQTWGTGWQFAGW
jgi:hypothetical protein